MPSLVYLVIYLCLHACAARPLTGLNSVSKIEGLERTELETFLARGNIVPESSLKISVGTRLIQFGNHRTSPVESTEGTKGRPSVKISCSRKVLLEAAARKAWKKSQQSTPESPPSNGEETVTSKDNRTPEEDIVVVDYEQPHRKPPIHNWEP